MGDLFFHRKIKKRVAQFYFSSYLVFSWREKVLQHNRNNKMSKIDKNAEYDVTISNREDASVEYTHYGVNHEAAKYWVGQYGNDPEYDVNVRVVESNREEIISYIH